MRHLGLTDSQRLAPQRSLVGPVGLTSPLSFSLSQSNLSPSEVVQWSNHRVMEWLRSVDLAEYAPNLRGSGVHGGLIVSGSLSWSTCLGAPGVFRN